MEHDVTQLIGAVDREVTSRQHDGRDARVVRVGRTYDTTVEDLWDALTSADRIPRWFMPISGELRVGGRYQLQGNAGGEITRCDPPTHLAITWEYGGEISWVQVRLSAGGNGGAHLELEHVAHVEDARWDEYGPGAVGVGWDLALVGLDWHVATGAANDPEAAAAWTMSEEGRAFIAGSSAAWGRASSAAGTDEAAAVAAAARTTAFYTGG